MINDDTELKNILADLSYGRYFFLRDEDAYCIRQDKRLMVAVPCPLKEPFCADFANCRVEYVSNYRVGDLDLDMLIFSMSDNRDSTSWSDTLALFAKVAESFVKPGEERDKLRNNPAGWWKTWSQLLGNSNRYKNVSAVMAELYIYECLLKAGREYTWTGGDKTRIDFMGAEDSIEVKSTQSRGSKEVEMHGKYQGVPQEEIPTHLMFCVMEKNLAGKSINDMVDVLSGLGIDGAVIDQELEKLGFRIGMPDRNTKYVILEALQYEINEDIPSLTPDKFINGKFPEGITRWDYTVSLENLSYEKVL